MADSYIPARPAAAGNSEGEQAYGIGRCAYGSDRLQSFPFREGLQRGRSVLRADSDRAGTGRTAGSSGAAQRRHGGQHRPLGGRSAGAPLVPARGGRAVCAEGAPISLYHGGDCHYLLRRRRVEFLFQMSAHALFSAACADWTKLYLRLPRQAFLVV